jgi:hypothetical protein
MHVYKNHGIIFEKKNKEVTKMTENSLLKNMFQEQSKSYTENGATAYNTSADDLVDLFAVCGALRSRPEDVDHKMARAILEDRLLTTKLAFYTRDVRGGLGEREVGRRMFHFLAVNYPDIMRKNLSAVAEYGRWDDVLSLMDTPLREDVISLVGAQLSADIANMEAGKPVSLLAKWMPSVNTSSRETTAAARFLCKSLGMNERTYRKTLSSLRSGLNVTEVPMSAKNFEYIRYEAVPSKAMNNYRKAFARNDKERFEAYLEDVKAGKAKINAAALFPYDIVEKILYQGEADAAVLEAQWKALPNYVDGENNFLVMADVSGSMTGRPMATSVGLAMYFAERNKGAFANTFMTFSTRPELVQVPEGTLTEKVRYVESSDWDGSTNLEAAFRLILDTAVKNHSPKEDMPKSIIVISDMEIDCCTDIDSWGFYDGMKHLFEDAGYEIPNVVFWNVDARNDTFHAQADEKGVQLASGSSPSVFKSLIAGVDLTPYSYMLSVLNQPRYDRITI